MSYPWKEYFSFTRRERTGIIILLIIIFFLNLIPVFFRQRKSITDHSDFDEFQKAIAALKRIPPDSPGNIYPGRMNKINDREESSGNRKQTVSLFAFDPNIIEGDEWRKLGLKDKTIQTILNFRRKGGKFRKRQDIARIYGLSRDEYERLLPYVHIKSEGNQMVTSRRHDTVNAQQIPGSATIFTHKNIQKSLEVDVNKGDTTSFISLPGIGSKLAGRIVYFRERLGGFYSVEQLREIYGLQDSTYLKIIPFLRCEPMEIKKLDINTAELTVLKNHPYIKWKIANAIVNYRQQHGNFKTLDELIQINLINADLLKKIKPYFLVNE